MTTPVVAPPRGRGSKPPRSFPRSRSLAVAPPRGRGSKQTGLQQAPSSGWSPPHGGVDRNHAAPPSMPPSRRVAPPRGRGSKQGYAGQGHRSKGVAPPRGRGSKRQKAAEERARAQSPPHGGVDRNAHGPEASAVYCDGRPPTGAWIETFSAGTRKESIWRSPPHGGVDRNNAQHDCKHMRAESPPHGGVDRNRHRIKVFGAGGSRPPTGAWIETCLSC